MVTLQWAAIADTQNDKERSVFRFGPAIGERGRHTESESGSSGSRHRSGSLYDFRPRRFTPTAAGLEASL